MYGGHYPPLAFDARARPPPLRFEDRTGRTIDIREYGDGPVDDEYGALVGCYLTFAPRHRSFGLPPTDEDRIRAWQDTILRGHCVVAWHGDRAVGQAVLVPDGEGDHEFAIFVHQDYHAAGIGTQLTHAVLALGRDRGVDRVWLLVEGSNRDAVQLYREVGFTLRDRQGPELEMWLDIVAAA
ncbi:GNAT family N-acetyltransferase [Salinirubellus salinus]|uniref:GNAT family N-acetyltransferase n=1 Tax=Salinirubellus salinus TaxID=1364945 RepID=A0A9E7R177_9EURY|nr:GNAT family N-acetyltransferase [Salinirubellus salinus]UWM53742.1 GNAT family N-acetyltransferase [Salinirubellus salinus]